MLGEETRAAASHLGDGASDADIATAQSFVALRLASGADERAHEWATAGSDCAKRWAAAAAILETKIAELRAVEVMVAATSDSDGAPEL